MKRLTISEEFDFFLKNVCERDLIGLTNWYLIDSS